jgi:hypothetical protein
MIKITIYHYKPTAEEKDFMDRESVLLNSREPLVFLGRNYVIVSKHIIYEMGRERSEFELQSCGGEVSNESFGIMLTRNTSTSPYPHLEELELDGDLEKLNKFGIGSVRWNIELHFLWEKIKGELSKKPLILTAPDLKINPEAKVKLSQYISKSIIPDSITLIHSEMEALKELYNFTKDYKEQEILSIMWLLRGFTVSADEILCAQIHPNNTVTIHKARKK